MDSRHVRRRLRVGSLGLPPPPGENFPGRTSLKNFLGERSPRRMFRKAGLAFPPFLRKCGRCVSLFVPHGIERPSV